MLNELNRVLIATADAFEAEATRVWSIHSRYPQSFGTGNHPGVQREAHLQALAFEAARGCGLYAQMETAYAHPEAPNRRLDLGLWSESVQQWAFLEIKHCGPHMGFLHVLGDGEKLMLEQADGRPENKIRAVLAYGVRDPVGQDNFEDKYRRLGDAFKTQLGFQEIGIEKRLLPGDPHFAYALFGAWAMCLP